MPPRENGARSRSSRGSRDSVSSFDSQDLQIDVDNANDSSGDEGELVQLTDCDFEELKAKHGKLEALITSIVFQIDVLSKFASKASESTQRELQCRIDECNEERAALKGELSLVQSLIEKAMEPVIPRTKRKCSPPLSQKGKKSKNGQNSGPSRSPLPNNGGQSSSKNNTGSPSKQSKNVNYESNPEVKINGSTDINLNNNTNGITLENDPKKDEQPPVHNVPLISNNVAQNPDKSTDTNYNVPNDRKLPIMLRVQANSLTVIKTLNDKFGPGIEARLAGAYYKVFTVDSNQHRAVSNYLREEGHDAYVIPPPETRSLKAVIKGIPSLIDENSVLQDLIQMGFSPIKVTRMPHPKTKAPMPMLRVELPRNEKSAEIYNIKYCCSLLVRVETLKFQGIGQCFNCNLFGHTAKQCLSRTRCLKCGENHQTFECKLPRVENPVCINCGATGHTAAYRSCPVFPKTKDKQRKTFPPAFRDMRSYANVTGNAFPPLSGESPPQLNLGKEIGELGEAMTMLKGLFDRLGGVSLILGQLREAKNDFDMLKVVLDILTKINTNHG